MKHTFLRVQLPMPPTVNKFVARFGNSNNEVVKWRKKANAAMMSRGKHPGKIEGKVFVTIIWDKGYEHRDVDNSIKPLLDYLQDVELIGNDKVVRELHVMFGIAPEGCIVEIESMEEPEDARPDKKDSISHGDARPVTGL